MAIDPNSIHAGMQVLGIEGEPVGRVVRFDPAASPRSSHAHAALPATAGAPAAMPASAEPVSPDVGSAPGTPGEGGRDALHGYGAAGDVEAGRRRWPHGRGTESERGGYDAGGAPPAGGVATGVPSSRTRLPRRRRRRAGIPSPACYVTPGERVSVTAPVTRLGFGRGRSLDLNDQVSA
jgi:hypothetical protein